MNEFLLLALIVIYLTISYPPKSKQPNSNGGGRTRRFFPLVGKNTLNKFRLIQRDRDITRFQTEEISQHRST